MHAASQVPGPGHLSDLSSARHSEQLGTSGHKGLGLKMILGKWEGQASEEECGHRYLLERGVCTIPGGTRQGDGSG